jgi:ribosomal protein S18 acetylase RimI-like enzyme
MARRPSPDQQRVVVRRLRKRDLEQVRDLQRECFPGVPPWTKEQFYQLIEQFPDGQLCVELDGQVVATSSALLVDGSAYTQTHTYRDLEIGHSTRAFDPEGDTLYGIDIAVRPRSRGFRFARRLYEARKELVRARNLRRIVIGGRVPSFHRYADSLTIHDYVAKVVRKEIRDPTINAQLANGFLDSASAAGIPAIGPREPRLRRADGVAQPGLHADRNRRAREGPGRDDQLPDAKRR